MTLPNPQKLSALHRRRGLHLPRAETTAKVVDATPPPKSTAPAPVVDRPKETTTATPEKSAPTPVLPLIPTISLPPLLGLGATTTTSHITSSSTTSTTAVSVTPSSITTSLPTTQRTLPVVTSTSHIVVQATTRFSSSTHTPEPSAVARGSSGLSTVTLIGGIGGALGATILFTVVVAFFLRRWRKRKATEDAFDASKFRRSAILLDEKDDDIRGRPRPPTMIERRNVSPTAAAASLSSPSAAYPYSDQPPVFPSAAPLSGNERAQSFAQHGAHQGQYGAVPLQPPSFAAGNQFGGAPNVPTTHYGANPYAGQGDPFATYAIPGQGHEQSGYGAPPMPGTHGPGAYAPYGVDPRYPQYQRYPRQRQSPQFGQGPAVDTGSGASLTREESISSLVNPFAPLPVPTKLGPTEGSGSGSISTSTSSSSSISESTRGASFVTRQSQEAPPAYTNAGVYTDVKRDVKVSPSTSASSLRVVNDNANSDVPDTTKTTTTKSNGSAPKLRPLSSYTLYNDDDAYGGM
ncbi:hypothetical protein BYT27DRAFT_7211919 [Phlegmacium glaucopus]|nr:hypothetical protein BYT27DRAFT_7211919 [Phlegmacium glaucopus]